MWRSVWEGAMHLLHCGSIELICIYIMICCISPELNECCCIRLTSLATDGLQSSSPASTSASAFSFIHSLTESCMPLHVNSSAIFDPFIFIPFAVISILIWILAIFHFSSNCLTKCFWAMKESVAIYEWIYLFQQVISTLYFWFKSNAIGVLSLICSILPAFGIGTLIAIFRWDYSLLRPYLIDSNS